MAENKNLVKYAEFTIEQAEAELAEMEKLTSNSDYMKLTVGRNVIRILPSNDTTRATPFVVVMEHFLRLPGAQRPLVFACPQAQQSQKGRCPACEQAQRLRASGNPADRETAYDISAKLRVYACVINRKEPEKGPQILPFGKTVYERLISIRKDSDAGGDYSDPVNGFDIVIERRGTGRTDTEYAVFASRKQSPLHPDAAQASDWLERIVDLGRFARARSYDELRANIQKEGGFGGGGQPTSGGRGQQPIDVQARSTRTADADMDDDISF